MPPVEPQLARSLLFALATGALFTPWLLVLSPALGEIRALSGYLVLSVLVHPLATAGYHRGKIGMGVAAALGTVLLLWLWLGPPGLLVVALLTTFIVGLVRGTLTAPAAPSIGLLREATIAALALGPALFMFDGRLVGTSIALWWFWLIQGGAAVWPEPVPEDAPPGGIVAGAGTDRSEATAEGFDALAAEATRVLDRLEGRAGLHGPEQP